MMSRKDNFKIATWNVCLGIANKKDIVTETLKQESISICCLQETEINTGFPEEILNCNGYVLELEKNDTKKRTGIYIHKDLKYKKRFDLECDNMHIVIIDIVAVKPIRVINVYRSFRPLDRTPIRFFEEQINVIKNALCKNCYILGDFNLDARMDSRPDYDRKIPLAILNDFANNKNIMQIFSCCRMQGKAITESQRA